MRELLSERSFWFVVISTVALLAYLAWLTHTTRNSK